MCAFPAGSRDHGPAHGPDGRHRPAQGAAEPLAGTAGDHPDRARHDSGCRACHPKRRLRLSDKTGRQAGLARSRAKGPQSVGVRARRRGLALEHHHAQSTDGGQVGAGQHGGRHRCARIAHRRERHGQRAVGARHSRSESPAQQAVRHHQLQCDGRESSGIGALRPRKRRLSGRHPLAERPVRDGGWGHPAAR